MSQPITLYWQPLKRDYNVPAPADIFPQYHGDPLTKYSAIIDALGAPSSWQPVGGWEYAAKLLYGTKDTEVALILPHVVERDWLGRVWGIWYDPPLGRDRQDREKALKAAVETEATPEKKKEIEQIGNNPVSAIVPISLGQPISQNVKASLTGPPDIPDAPWGPLDYAKWGIIILAGGVVIIGGAVAVQQVQAAVKGFRSTDEKRAE